MGEGGLAEEGLAVLQGGNNGGRRFVHMNAREQGDRIRKETIPQNPLRNFKAVIQAHLKVLRSMGRRCVDQARSCITSDVGAGQQRHGEIIPSALEGVAGDGSLQKSPVKGAHPSVGLKPRPLAQSLYAGVSHQKQSAGTLVRFHQGIGKLRAVGDRPVGGQSPGSRCPNHRVGTHQIGMGAVGDPKGDINGLGSDILVFNLCFRKGGFFHNGPENWFNPPVDISCFKNFQESGHDARFFGGRHGGVKGIPIPPNAEALEFLLLHINPFLGKDTASGSKF